MDHGAALADTHLTAASRLTSGVLFEAVPVEDGHDKSLLIHCNKLEEGMTTLLIYGKTKAKKPFDTERCPKFPFRYRGKK